MASPDDPPRFVTANGVRFAYLESGTGPLVLLVHGFPDTARTWDHARAALAAEGFRAVAVSTRGYAPTAIPDDGRYDPDTLGRDLVQLIPALGEERAVVVGHDWGASAAYSAATLAPERVRKLVTLAIPHPASLTPSPRLAWALRHFVDLRLPGAEARMRRDDFAHVDTLVRRWSPAWDVPAGATDDVKEAFRQPGSLHAALAYYRQLGMRVPASQRERIAVPTVAFAGETDILPPEAYERARSRFTGPYAIVRMPGGHFMHREDPATFARELLQVLGQGPV
jgi:pimeloyl-ACP methyl ester carboxylesterase